MSSYLHPVHMGPAAPVIVEKQTVAVPGPLRADKQTAGCKGRNRTAADELMKISGNVTLD